MLRRLAEGLLRGLGWRVAGDVPAVTHCVVVAAPHTSNWDLLYLLLMAWARGLKISWLAKHSLFWPPLGWVLRSLGGVPVVRHRPEQRVSATATLFRELPSLFLVIPPEGTRSRTAHWKSGFYWIAREAQVPVLLTALDYADKAGYFGPLVDAALPPAEFMDQVRGFYAARQGRFPDDFGPVRLQDESPDS